MYRESEGADGYVSLEVSPVLAHNTAGTLAQAKQLWEWVGRPNLMVKIPATLEGIPAVRQAIAAGIKRQRNPDIFPGTLPCGHGSLSGRARGASNAGLEVHRIASVASFFVSRMDVKVDGLLDGIGSAEAMDLRGKAAIAYTRLAYDAFLRYSAASVLLVLMQPVARSSVRYGLPPVPRIRPIQTRCTWIS